MRLWLKVSVLPLILTTVAVSACSLIMLIRSGQSNLNLAVRYTLTDQQVRSASWATAMSGQTDKQYGATAERSLARYLIDKFADGNTILIAGNDVVYNCTTIEPTQYLPLSGSSQQYVVAEIGDRSILLAGSRVTIEHEDALLACSVDAVL